MWSKEAAAFALLAFIAPIILVGSILIVIF